MAHLATPPHRTGLLVFQPVKRKQCAECRGGPLAMLVLEDGAPQCLDCADLGHLVFLPRGDTALTRRSREESGLSAVVVRFNRRGGSKTLTVQTEPDRKEGGVPWTPAYASASIGHGDASRTGIHLW